MEKLGDFFGTQSPSKNPFISPEACEGEGSFRIAYCKDAGRPSLAAWKEGDLLPRESLGLLPESTLFRDSLTRESLIFNINSNTESEISKGLHDHTFTRESLGILNLSAMDLDRKSLGFNLDLIAIKGQKCGTFKDPNISLPVSQNSENKIPNILLSSVKDHSDSSNFSSLNKEFILSTSKKFPSTSSCSPILSENISYNARNLEQEVSRICSFSSRGIDNALRGLKLDPLNEAFQVMPEINFVSLSDKIGSSEFDADIEKLRNRIKSWPLLVDKNALLQDLGLGHNANASFDEGSICRGVEQEKHMVDSVFLATITESFSFEDKSFNEAKYLLDCTPQPEWGDWDTSNSTELKETSEDILKKMDKLFGAEPINAEEILSSKLYNKSGNSFCDNNISQDISQISRATQCSFEQFQGDCNLSQDLSKTSQYSSTTSAVDIIKNLSNKVDENQKFSVSEKKEAHRMLACLANLFKENGNNENQNTENSGRTSVDDHLENNENEDPNVYEILDLSCKSNGGTNKVKASSDCPKSPFVKNPPPYSVYSAQLIPNISNASIRSNSSINSHKSKLMNISGLSQNNSNSSSKNESDSRISFFRRQNSLTQNKATLSSNKLKKTASAGVLTSRQQPMRAILPIEKMKKPTKSSPKSTATPEKNTTHTFSLLSKKTSTPIHAPKVKPFAASTPAVHQNLGTNGRPRSRSFSYQARPTSDTQTVKRSASKAETLKSARANSISENTLGSNKNFEGIKDSPKRRRCSSSGKEQRILCALSKVRQNILNSPYYSRKSAGGEKTNSALPVGTTTKAEK